MTTPASPPPPPTTRPPPLRVALAVDTECCSGNPWWRRVVDTLSRQHLVLVALWAPEAEIATRAARALGIDGIALFHGFGQKALWEDDQIDNVDLMLVDVAKGPIHVSLLDQLFKSRAKAAPAKKKKQPPFLPHLISMNDVGTTFTPDEYSRLFQEFKSAQKYQQQHHRDGKYVPYWGVIDPVRCDASVTGLKAIMEELGPLLSASVICSEITPFNLAPRCVNLNGLILKRTDHRGTGALVSCVTLLRSLFGEISSTCVAPSNGAVLSGWAKFAALEHNNFTCSLNVIKSNLIPNSDIQIMKVSVWGTKGRGTLIWDAAKEYFVTQRCLKHFEHPGLHGISGDKLSLGTQIEAIIHSKDNPGSLVPIDTSDPLVSLMIADSIDSTRGSVVNFRPK